ncbi:bifunctional diguanylate cyclase/phosphodiesterase [Marinobacterium rhizophilum]|uniref:EAL and GGDEF domain-containing protein n=1 Tax=Marinobacterium rhizophilum TaxID=420402 RepID=A0ABY5HIA9_9GAMM|nr:bifunctional diguanylate cyclase/phosphodiesterase [Marinobacterium rhizophilum]UTW12103.1 EAL and GGDEF domain-containing protein [Marinobacterium rhizophilum]
MLFSAATQALPGRTSHLKRILQHQALTPYFQPIVDIQRGELVGHEALIRGPKGSELESPAALFDTAMEASLMPELELLCRRLTLERFAELNPAGKLFLNINVSLLRLPGHPHGLTREWLEELNIPQDRVVIELSEQQPFDNNGVTLAAVKHYQDSGFWIAIDDLGAGYSGLKLWSELSPSYVKIDKHFVRGIDQDNVKWEFVKAIINIARSTGCRVIAEGIETEEELRTLQMLGVMYGQGFLLGRPSPAPVDAATYEPLGKAATPDLNTRRPTETAAVLLNTTPFLSLNDSVAVATRLLRTHSELSMIPILHDGEPVGVVRREKLWEVYSSEFGKALFEQKPVTKVLSKDFLAVESNTPLEEVSQLVTGHDEFYLQQDIVITQAGRLVGMGRVRDLLRHITELKLRDARSANPLTLLPGNIPINERLCQLLKDRCDFHVAYFDLNHFKAYNDHYGFDRGDQVIRYVGQLISRHAGTADTFVGHIGGDDFIVIFSHADWHRTCQDILTEFDQGLAEFYDPQHILDGGIWAEDRHGQQQFYTRMGLAVGVVHPDPLRCSSHEEVSQLATGAKKQAKTARFGPLFVSSRRAL